MVVQWFESDRGGVYFRLATLAGVSSCVGRWWIIQQNRHRPIVDQGDLHVCAEHAALDGPGAESGQFFAEALVHRFRLRWVHGVDVAGALAASRISEQGELRDNQILAAYVFAGEVHLALGLVENAQPVQLSEQLLHFAVGVAALRTEQDEQAAFDLADDLAIDADAGG